MPARAPTAQYFGRFRGPVSMDAVKAFYVKEHQLEADVGNKYASFRAIGLEGIEQK